MSSSPCATPCHQVLLCFHRRSWLSCMPATETDPLVTAWPLVCAISSSRPPGHGVRRDSGYAPCLQTQQPLRLACYHQPEGQIILQAASLLSSTMSRPDRLPQPACRPYRLASTPTAVCSGPQRIIGYTQTPQRYAWCPMRWSCTSSWGACWAKSCMRWGTCPAEASPQTSCVKNANPLLVASTC